jgi:hypothetical protein
MSLEPEPSQQVDREKDDDDNEAIELQELQDNHVYIERLNTARNGSSAVLIDEAPPAEKILEIESPAVVAVEAQMEKSAAESESSGPPHISFWKLFMLFISFGLRAWGGPVAQIAMIKQQLVIEEKWITVKKFNRVLGIYQVLPGPEAAVCCHDFDNS